MYKLKANMAETFLTTLIDVKLKFEVTITSPAINGAARRAQK